VGELIRVLKEHPEKYYPYNIREISKEHAELLRNPKSKCPACEAGIPLTKSKVKYAE